MHNPNKPLAGLDLFAAWPSLSRCYLSLQSQFCCYAQGKALNEVASEDCKVLVVGNPCNTNALICMENAPRLQRKNFHALMRLDENRAKCQLALKAQRPYTCVTNLCVWGNHSTTQVSNLPSRPAHSLRQMCSYVDLGPACLVCLCRHAYNACRAADVQSVNAVAQVPDFLNACIAGEPAVDVVKDEHWFQHDFTPTVAGRGESHALKSIPTQAGLHACQHVLPVLQTMADGIGLIARDTLKISALSMRCSV